MGRWLNRDPLKERGSLNLRGVDQYLGHKVRADDQYSAYFDQEMRRLLNSEAVTLAQAGSPYSFVTSNPIGDFDPNGLAKYGVYWTMKGVSFIYIGGVKIEGIVISMEKSYEGICNCLYEFIDFEGVLYGVSVGLPVGVTVNNKEVFEDIYEEPDVRRIQGWSWLLAGTAALKEGYSGGVYHFGQLSGTSEEISRVEGYEFGVDYVGGKLHTKGEVGCVEDHALRWQFGE